MKNKVSHGVSPTLKKKKISAKKNLELAIGTDIQAVTESAAHPNFKYHGGPIVKNPQVYSIFLGDWSSEESKKRNATIILADLREITYFNAERTLHL